MKRFGLAAVLALTAALLACKPPPKASSQLPPPKAAPLIARADLFGNPDRAQARISPNGDYIAFLAPKDGYLNLFVMRTGDDVASARAVTADAKRGIRRFLWAANGAQILYLQDEGGDELAEVKVDAGFKLNRQTAEAWVDASFAKPGSGHELARFHGEHTG